MCKHKHAFALYMWSKTCYICSKNKENQSQVVLILGGVSVCVCVCMSNCTSNFFQNSDGRNVFKTSFWIFLPWQNFETKNLWHQNTLSIFPKSWVSWKCYPKFHFAWKNLAKMIVLNQKILPKSSKRSFWKEKRCQNWQFESKKRIKKHQNAHFGRKNLAKIRILNQQSESKSIKTLILKGKTLSKLAFWIKKANQKASKRSLWKEKPCQN